MSDSTIYGIDLGTTYSCLAWVDEYERPTVHKNKAGDETTPSVVQFEVGNVVVGDAAKENAKFDPQRVVSLAKRHMGDADAGWTIDGTRYRPQQISAFVLDRLVKDAKELSGREVRDVVITCPAYFGTNEKEATKEAGLIAGLNVRYVIPEPTAAAIAYGVEQDDDQTVLVYDLGGGTFDITVLEIRERSIRMVCTGGDRRLGGADWDEDLVEWMVGQFVAEHGGTPDDVLNDPETLAQLRLEAEGIKKNLTLALSAKHYVNHQGKRTKVEVTRETFDQITKSRLEGTVTLTRELMDRAKEKGVSKIDAVLLVGGSTFMPQVLRRLQEEFQCEVRLTDPNLIVAKGAALFGRRLQLLGDVAEVVDRLLGRDATDLGSSDPLAAVPEKVKQQALEDVSAAKGVPLHRLGALVDRQVEIVTSKSFGVVVIDERDQEVVAHLVVRDDKVPATVTETFPTYKDNQRAVDLRVMENSRYLSRRESLPPGDCDELGKALLEFSRPLPAGSPIEVTFALSADGLLSLRGRDLTTGGEVTAQFQTGAQFTAEELKDAQSQLIRMAPRS